MFAELPQILILMTGGAFVLGWLLSYISSKLGSKYKATQRDPRDDRIRSLEAELRVAQTHKTKSLEELEKLEDQLKETTVGLERRDNVISEQQSKIEMIAKDLKDSVQKTRELRTDLADKATENVQAEAKIREVETELSVAHASRDMLATGVLDYQDAPGSDDADDEDGNDQRREFSGAAT